MEDYITRPEHEEFKKRLENEESRQNKRLDIMETRIDKLTEMQTALAVMQADISSISQDVKKIGEEVDSIQQEPADKWKKAVWIVITVIITAVVTYFIKG